MKKLKIGFVQQACSASLNENRQKSLAGIRKAAQQGAKLIVLPELHQTLYFCKHEDPNQHDLAEPIPGPGTDYWSKLAKELQVVLVTSLFERRAPGLSHNTAAVFDTDGSIAGVYRKMHIPEDPGYHEKFYFTPGDLGFRPIQTSLGKLGVLVCWDQWYPEAARLMTLAGAELLIYPTAIGYDPLDSQEEQQRQRDSWLIAQRAHAVANGVFVVSVNRTGEELDPQPNKSAIPFWGSSFVVGPQGEYLAQASEKEEEVQVVEVDMGRTADVRRIWPFLRDRRIDAYGDLTKRYIDT